MTARVVHESLDGGHIAVGDTCQYVGCIAVHTHPVVIAATERGMGTAVLHLTRDESDDLIDALIARNQEIDAAALTLQATQTAPEGAGAAPAGDGRGALPVGGRTEATGLGVPPAEPGRPNSQIAAARRENPPRVRRPEAIDEPTCTGCNGQPNGPDDHAPADCPYSLAGHRADVPEPLVIDVAQAAAVAAEVHGTEEQAAYAAESAGDDDGIPNATPCNCEHEAHFADDDHAAIHAYGKAPAGNQRALYVGPVCNACATEHLSAYLIQGPAGVEEAGPDDMTEPDEPIGNLTGGNYYRSAVDAALRDLAFGPAGGAQ